MTRRHGFLRAGFVLPMSLVATFITMMIVAASATYCTTQFRTSGEYLNRTRCRLLAQSAIELVKLEIDKRREGLKTGIPDPGNPNFHNADLNSIVAEVKNLAKQETFLRQIPGYGPDFDVYVDIKPENGINRIYATAIQRDGDRSTSVTLQENIKIPMSDANIFLYAYFANGDGHLTSQYLTVNGDVRSNRKFTLTGSEINGFIYSHEPPQINIKKKHSLFGGWLTWYDGKDVEIRNPKSYNSEYRGYPYKTANGIKTKYDVKARPTNPLVPDNDKTAWEGGFKGVSGEKTTTTTTTKKKRKNFWDWLFGGGETETTTTTTIASTMPIDEDLMTISDEHVVVTNVSTLYMPKIETDADLASYKSYAASAHNAAGGTGGRLVCSNCYRKADGTVAQLSASLLLPWIETRGDADIKPDMVDPKYWLKKGEDEYNTEPLDVWEADYDRSKAGQYAPKNSVLVYDCISASDYQKMNDTQKANWRPLVADPTPGSDEFSSGYAGTIPVGTHAGTSLFFGTENLEASLMSRGFDEADARRLIDKFNDDRWTKVAYHILPKSETYYIDAGYEPVAGKTYWVTLYKYATSVPQVYNSWTRRYEDESGWTSISSKDPYYEKDPRCFRSSEMSGMSSTLYNAYKSYFGTTWNAQSAVNSAISDAKSGWTEKSSRYGNNGYYKSSSIQGYIAFDLVRYYEEGKDDTYKVESNIVSTKSPGVKATSTPKPSSRTIYVYDSVYYSSLPAGYIELSIVTNTYKETTIDVSYTPFPQLPKPEENEVRKTLETKFVQLYEYNSSWWSPGRDWSAVNSSGFRSGYCNVAATAGSLKNRIVKQSDVATVAAQFERDFPAVDADAVAEGMLDGDWSETTQGYYKSGSSYGYLAISLIGVYRGGDVSYEFEYAYASASDKTRIESQTSELDVMEVVYLPVHEYSKDSKSGWTRLQSDSTGFVNSKSDSPFRNKFMLMSERDAALEGFEGSFYGSGISSDAIKNYFTSQTGRNAGWGKPEYQSSGWFGGNYGYYNPQVAGYMAVKVVRGGTDYRGRTTYSLDYSSFVEPEEATTQDGGTGNDTVAGNCIPVYEHLSVDEWNGLAYWQKTRWTKVTKTGYTTQEHIREFESSHDDMYFAQESLNSVANYCASQDSSLASKAGEIRSKVLALFTDSNGPGAKDGWEGGCTSGYIGKHPVGYLQVDVTADTHDAYNILADYAYLSVNEGEVGDKKHYDAGEKVIKPGVDDPTYFRDHPDELAQHLRDIGHFDEYATIEHDPDPNYPVTRELRRIFVKDGYKIDTDDPKLFELDDKGNRIDLVLTRQASGTASEMLSSGKKTEDLRPFREDRQYNCNRRTPQFNGKYLDQGAVILIGTWDFPICIDGPVVFDSDVIIRGFVSGRGTIYSGRNIHIIGDINYKNPPYWPDNGATEPDTRNRDLLVLISRGSIVFGNYVKDDLWIDKSNGLLAGNYINHQVNKEDGLNRAYTEKNYLENETKFKKVSYIYESYNKKNSRLADENVKYYESVVGDYVFISENNSNGTQPLALKDSLTKNHCDCRFSQHWDVNPNNSFSGYDQYASYQSSIIEAYVNSKNWGVNDRVGLTSKSFYWSIWNSSDFKATFCRNNYATTPTTYNYFSYDKPFVNCIQSVNAVLYSSMGIYGIVGGSKTPVVINGAIIGQDEALLPFTRNRRRSYWSSKSEDLRLTLNWDIRLNKQSGDAVKNKDEGDVGTPQSSSEDSEATDIKVLSWQEVPDSFNEEYHATP